MVVISNDNDDTCVSVLGRVDLAWVWKHWVLSLDFDSYKNQIVLQPWTIYILFLSFRILILKVEVVMRVK